MSGGRPTDGLNFRWPWRPYQERVLDTVDRHLRDDRLHIVAAPGAGKTTLGLEVFRRLGKPALVLAPTRTIRNQWLRRLEDFLPVGDHAARDAMGQWTSSDLHAPAFFTVATYQAVHTSTRADEAIGDGEEEDEGAPSVEEVASLIGTLQGAGVGTLILDEAHHLKRAWWRALERVVAALEGVTLVSLTGTPPYDATGIEWRRYEELCGPIDDEISVPELVRAGTLCAHQDFVYAVAPRADEASEVRRHDEAIDLTLAELLDDPRFQAEVDAHPWVASDALDLDAVLGEPEVAVALIVYLRATGAGLPPALLMALDLGSGELPWLDRGWWQVLLKEYLHGGSFEVDDDYQRALAKVLRDRGLLWRRSLRIVRSAPAERKLALSSSKIDACVEIHHAERALRGDGLRQVILADYIRDESVNAEPGAALADLGAFPVFDALVRETGHRDVAMISGRLAVVHESLMGALVERLGPDSGLLVAPLPNRPGWARVSGVGSGVLVGAFTDLLKDGELVVLVGTRSLLGEGWDAPAVNSIILASFVGAFVSTNQMRGRAIRRNPRVRDKVASVWHLVAVARDTPTGFADYDLLAERFKTFVGLSADGEVIGSGIARLALPKLDEATDLEAFNGESIRRLNDLDGIAQGWRRAIDGSGTAQVIPTVSLRKPPTVRPMVVRNTIRAVMVETGLAGLVAGVELLRQLLTSGGGGLGFVIASAIPLAMFTPQFLRALRLAYLHAPIDGAVSQIGKALLEALIETGLVTGDEVRTRTGRTSGGGVHVSLEGGTFYEQSLFADAIREILGPVENPRYLITRRVDVLVGERVDYHAVPSALGAKKELAEVFQRAWRRHVGACQLIYTRREGGRAQLLAARGRALSGQFVDPVERLDRWQ